MKSTLVLGVLLLGLVCCINVEKSEKAQNLRWTERMQELSGVLNSLFPFIWSKEDFNDPKNFSEIEQKVKKLSELAQSVNHKAISDSPDHDPAVASLAKNFDAGVKKAYEGLQGGFREYSRHALIYATSHCVGCHTRNGEGKQYDGLALNINFEKLSPFARAEAYTATRQFKKAADEYFSIVMQNRLVMNYPFEVEAALGKALAIYIRVLNDQDGALQLVQKFLQSNEIPLFLERQAQFWKRDLITWKAEKAISLNKKDEVLKKIERLIADAELDEGKLELGNPLISYLRATALGHSYLAKYNDDVKKADILLGMGICYEYLQELGYWTLSEDYFVQCIHEKPHSPVAVKCLYRFERSVYLGYTGSAGTRIPGEVREQLRQLRSLAL